MNEQSARSGFATYRAKRTTPRIRLTVAIVLVARRWRALIDDFLRPAGHSSARLEVLAAIINAPDPKTQVDIAKRLRIEGPTLTRMLDTLAREGLVERTPSPDDRRAKHLSVTPKGEATLEEMFDSADMLRAHLLRGIPDDKVHELIGIFEAMLERLDSDMPQIVAGDGAGD